MIDESRISTSIDTNTDTKTDIASSPQGGIQTVRETNFATGEVRENGKVVIPPQISLNHTPMDSSVDTSRLSDLPPASMYGRNVPDSQSLTDIIVDTDHSMPASIASDLAKLEGGKPLGQNIDGSNSSKKEKFSLDIDEIKSQLFDLQRALKLDPRFHDIFVADALSAICGIKAETIDESLYGRTSDEAASILIYQRSLPRIYDKSIEISRDTIDVIANGSRFLRELRSYEKTGFDFGPLDRAFFENPPIVLKNIVEPFARRYGEASAELIDILNTLYAQDREKYLQFEALSIAEHLSSVVDITDQGSVDGQASFVEQTVDFLKARRTMLIKGHDAEFRILKPSLPSSYVFRDNDPRVDAFKDRGHGTFVEASNVWERQFEMAVEKLIRYGMANSLFYFRNGFEEESMGMQGNNLEMEEHPVNASLDKTRLVFNDSKRVRNFARRNPNLYKALISLGQELNLFLDEVNGNENIFEKVYGGRVLSLFADTPRIEA